MYKKIIFIFFCIVSSSLFSENEKMCKENSCIQINDVDFLSSARKCVKNCLENKSSGFISDINFIYFQAKEDGFDFAFDNQTTEAAATGSIQNLNGNTKEFEFKYAPGFKIALGFYIPKISWDMILNWTYLYEKNSYVVSRGLNSFGAGIIPIFGNTFMFKNNTSLIRYERVKPEFKLHFHSVDLEVGNSFYIKKYLSFRIHGGLKGASIHQKLIAQYLGGSTFTNLDSDSITLNEKRSLFRSSSKGLGPRIGIDSLWNICNSNYNIIANTSCSFLLTRFNLTYLETDLGYNNTTLEDLINYYGTDEYIWVVRPQTQFTLGLEWSNCFACKYHLSLKAAYEAQYFFDQNLSRKLIDDQLQGLSYPNKGDLLLHGLIIACHFEF